MTPTAVQSQEGIALYIPFESQSRFHASPHFEVLYGGSTGPGKTRAIGEDVLEVALEAPGCRLMVARLKEKDVKATTMAVFFDEVWPQVDAYWRDQAQWRASDLELKLWPVNGRRSSIKFMGLLSSAGQEDVGKIKSTSVSSLWLDEVTEIPEKLFFMWHTQVRFQVTGLRRNQIKMATNPEPGTWAYYRYIVHRESGKPWTPEELAAEGREFIPALSKDNPFLPDGYQERFDHMPEWMQKRYRDGDWSFFVGQAIQGWDESRLVIPWQPLDHYKYMTFVYIDHGQSNPCSVHRYNIDSWGNKIVDAEYYSPGLVSQHCEAIKRLMDVPNLGGVYIDGTTFAKGGERNMEAWSIADEYLANGVPVLPSSASGTGDKIKVARWEAAIKFDPERIHPFDEHKRGGQEIWIMDNNVNFIREIPNQKWKDPARDGENTPEKLVDRDNHAFDESSYFLCDQREDFIPTLEDEGEAIRGVEYML